MLNNKHSYHFYAVITILFWSLAFVFSRLALQYFTAFSLGFLRYMVASVTLLVVAVVTKMQMPHKKDLPRLCLAGALGFFIYMIAFNQGQRQVTASTASVVMATVPVMTALIARTIYKEKLRVLQWVAIAIEFIGVAVLTLMNGALSVNSGLLWLLLAALALCLYNLLQRGLTKKYSALQTTSFSIFFGTLMLGIFLPESWGQAVNAPPVQWVYLVFLGVFASAIAYLSWAMAFARAQQTSQVSNYMFLTPFLTSILGFIIVGEVPEASSLLGGGIILLGVFIFNFGDKLLKKLYKR